VNVTLLALVAAPIVGFALLAVGPRAFAVCLVVGMFVSRPAVDVVGYSVRLEVVLGGIAGLRLALEPALLRRLSKPAAVSVLLCVGWLYLAVAASVAWAPERGASLSLIVWCATSLATAVWIACQPTAWVVVVRAGVYLSCVAATAALGLWFLAAQRVATIGVQPDSAYGGYAPYLLSIEANLLAGLLCLWGLVAVYNPRGSIQRAVTFYSVLVTPAALLVTHTRAALIAYAFGLLATLLLRRGALRATAIPLGIQVLALPFALSATKGDVGLDKFRDLIDLQGGTGGQRVETMRTALVDYTSAGWVERAVGLGFNSFSQRHYEPSLPGRFVPAYLGNLPVQILYDGGIAAVVLLGLAVVTAFVALARRGGWTAFVAIGIPYVVFSLATSSLWLAQTWVFVGLLWGSGRTWSRSTPDEAALSDQQSAHG